MRFLRQPLDQQNPISTGSDWAILRTLHFSLLLIEVFCISTQNWCHSLVGLKPTKLDLLPRHTVAMGNESELDGSSS